MLDESTRQQIVASVRQLRCDGTQFQAHFLDRLSRSAPSIAALLNARLDRNADLVRMAVIGLHHLHSSEHLLSAVLQELGREMADGLHADDLAPIGSALIQTVRDLLGRDFTQEAEEAWVTFYAHLAQQLEQGTV